MDESNSELELSCETVRDLLASDEPPLLIDCREPQEHAICSVEAARLMPMSELPTQVEALREAWQQSGANQPVIVMCHHGMRSAQVAAWLRGQGFADAKSMAGGIDLWSEVIDPSVPRY